MGTFAGRTILAMAVLALAACSNPLKPRIDAEIRQLNQAKDHFNQIRKEIEDDLKKEPNLFRAANVTAAWRDRFQNDQEKLNDAFTDLEKLNHRDKRMSLFADVDRFREAALSDAGSIQNEANRWLDLKRNTAAHLERMKADYDKIKSTDVSKTVAALEQAETDWPAKKADLESRIENLNSASAKADRIWADVEQAKDKPDYAALMTDSQWLESRANRPEKDLKLVSQLYDSKDVLLEHLDSPRKDDFTCGAKLKVISTHYTDAENRQTNTESKQKTEQFPPSRCELLQNDVGMEIEHKPAGAYDSEVQTVPQPPGFAYMAPPGQSNQYGHWEVHNGTSVWTWLPEYLLLRELLWNHQYVPVPSYEYEGYWSARRSGTTYYGPTYAPGQTRVESAPKYGTHGTFTTGRYADSRYQNRGGSFGGSQYQNQGSGGYRSSGYANGQSAGSSASGEQGHQFGRSQGSSGSSGKRFGSSGGSRPRSAPSGRRYGRR
ncbi:MAG TPA: hypothetical protein VGL72_33585 [Bryobacteraceae bacterium]|jgi:hypothetical protein